MPEVALTFTHAEIVSMALALGDAARSATNDDRLSTAATIHTLASKMWAGAGYPRQAVDHIALANAAIRAAIEAKD